MPVSVSEYAAARGISERRAIAMIADGRLPAQRLGRQWLIDERAFALRAGEHRRPMSSRIAWALIDVLSGQKPDGLSQSEASRVRKRAVEVARAPDPAAILAAWLRNRGQRIELSAQANELESLRNDHRLAPSGISDERSGISAPHLLEVQLKVPSEGEQVKREHLLVPGRAVNVILHIPDRPIDDQVPLGLVIADLADWNGPREDAAVARLLRSP